MKSYKLQLESCAGHGDEDVCKQAIHGQWHRVGADLDLATACLVDAE